MTQLTHRYIARLDIETTTPLTLRSGQKDALVDQIICRDALGLPHIPGTSLAGVLRAAYTLQADEQQAEQLFGFAGEKEAVGSRLLVSAGYVLGAQLKAVQTPADFLAQPDICRNTFGLRFTREHVRMNDKGVADDRGKFDEEILPTGVRFRFELSLLGTAEDEAQWTQLLGSLMAPSFALGGGTRRGRGQFKVLSCQQRRFDLQQPKDLSDWQQLSADLNTPVPAAQKALPQAPAEDGWMNYTLELKAKDFFITAKGFGDDDADKVYMQEQKISYAGDSPKLATDAFVLIPASSIKGALSHRVAYHYNRLVGNFADATTKARVAAFEQQVEILKQEARKAVDRRLAVALSSDRFEQMSGLDLQEPKKKIAQVRGGEADLGTAEILQKLKEDIRKSYEEHAQGGKMPHVGDENIAVRTLFGYANTGKSEEQKKSSGQRGHVLIQDIYIAKAHTRAQLFNHVKIDRFTGGAFAGALFSERTVQITQPFQLRISVAKAALADELVRQAWEAALQDLKTGMLPLGGGTAKGHGVFLSTAN